MEQRKICPYCNLNYVAVNYHKNGKIHYRSKCDKCAKKKATKFMPPGWMRSGYKLKDKCEKCGFKLKYPEQSSVFYIDGNLTNNDRYNLKTVCANCAIELAHSSLGWKQGGSIKPDF
jgi:rRNA maturation protein Nop10